MTDELNLEAIKARRYVANAPHDIRALVREVEHLRARIAELEAALITIEHDARLDSDPDRAHSCQISTDEMLSSFGSLADTARAALKGGE